MKQLAAALVAFQAEAPSVHKSAQNSHFKSRYAPLDEIVKAIQPVLAKHGLAVMQFPVSTDGAIGVRTVVMHSSGESMEGEFYLPLAKMDPQGGGSAITYARRYGLAGALGLVTDDDDDGNAAASAGAAAVRKPNQQPKPANQRVSAMGKVNKEKLIFAAKERAKELGDESISIMEILNTVARGLGRKEAAGFTDADYEKALGMVQEFEPGEVAA